MVVPLLFTVAFHATVDVPEAVAAAAAAPGVELVVADILGTGDDVAAVLRGALDGAGVDRRPRRAAVRRRLLRPEANAAVADLAARLAAGRPGRRSGPRSAPAPRGPPTCWPTSAIRSRSVPLFLADGLLLDPLRRLAAERGWPLVEPLGAQAAAARAVPATPPRATASPADSR